MFIPAPVNLFFSKNNPNDPRQGEFAKIRNINDNFSEEFALVGYPDDDGIQLGGGRPGSRLAPNKIREFFYKMTPSLFFEKPVSIADLGNLDMDQELSSRHEDARRLASSIFKKKKRLLSLGGGHDYGYSDASGFVENFIEASPLVINFDAHLDVRPLNYGLTSGTPFFRLLSEFAGKFDFLEVGIQSQCNSRFHLDWLKEKNSQVVFLQQIEKQGLVKSVVPLVGKKRPCFLSVDIDAFTSMEAPGCSQSWTTGLKTSEFLLLLEELGKILDLRGMGIYEVSPELDEGDRTSKLAALLLHQFVYL